MDYEYESQTDSTNVICPYCEVEYQPESEDYSADWSVVECEDCGKKYYSSQSFSVDHNTMPDCEINGEQHKWKSIILSLGTKHDFCSVCSKCKVIGLGDGKWK